MKVIAVLFLGLALPVFAQGFLPGTEDIPQMDGLTQVEEMASFDNPSERMVLIVAQTKESVQDVLKFYRENLTNLGWTERTKGKFERGADSFTIEVSSVGISHQIQFRLSQKNL